ncbi:MULTISPECIES: hypothetical protein [unclassified Janthinobacterium]|uniref:hypothetical protein n=1 Tax=unclassified Janthinobacterium TaxID=2610881 RepID=UPI000346DBC8|nr:MULTISPECIES: hypothetical protein [unclassified Janthinobacterium]MEC5163347.1 hypothetical protein [Janthinobacterium sp. CG_S6]
MKKFSVVGALLAACAIGAAAVLWVSHGAEAQHAAPVGGDGARPAVFNEGTAMRAIFGAYNSAQKGTLIPVANTAAWSLKGAEVLATPMLAVTYDDGGVEKGVLAIQRQTVTTDGEVVDSHATAADMSVYVFIHKGGQWVFEKGKQVAATAGAHGNAPNGRLLRIGDGKFGLLFEGGDVHQGVSNDYAILVDLSAATVRQTFEFETGRSNSGTCSDDPKELAEPGTTLHPCWGFEAKLAFLKNGPGEYFTIRATYSGTTDEDATKPLKKVEYYTMTKDGFKWHRQPQPQPRIAEALADEEVFGVGGGQGREANMATIPRRLLK